MLVANEVCPQAVFLTPISPQGNGRNIPASLALTRAQFLHQRIAVFPRKADVGDKDVRPPFVATAKRSVAKTAVRTSRNVDIARVTERTSSVLMEQSFLLCWGFWLIDRWRVAIRSTPRPLNAAFNCQRSFRSRTVTFNSSFPRLTSSLYCCPSLLNISDLVQRIRLRRLSVDRGYYITCA